MPRRLTSGKTALSKLWKLASNGLSGILHGVERIAELEHPQVEGGPPCAGEADEPRLPLLLRLIERLEDATLGVRELRVVVVDDAVDLPQVEVIGPEPSKRLLEHAEGELAAAPVRADLRHQENLVAPPLERLAQPVLGLAVVVLPAVVEERDAGIDRLRGRGGPRRRRSGGREMVAADTDGRHVDAGTTERSARDRAGTGVAPVPRRLAYRPPHRADSCTERRHALHELPTPHAPNRRHAGFVGSTSRSWTGAMPKSAITAAPGRSS